MEVGIPYVMTGPDGTRAVFNDTTDPDFVGYLDPENGVTGLLDSAPVRQSTTNIVEGDGAQQGNNFLGGKPGTIQGFLWPTDSVTMNLFESKIKRASRGLSAQQPAVLTWTPSGSVQRMIEFWRAGEVRFTARRPKQFVVPAFAPRPYQLSAAENNQTIQPNVAASELGIPDPITDPITSPASVSGQSFVTNIGDAPTWPRFRLNGPLSNATLVNNTTGEQIVLQYTLGTGDFLDIYAETGTIVLNGSFLRYSALVKSQSTWWKLQGGLNDIRLLVATYTSPPANLIVYWHHAWE